MQNKEQIVELLTQTGIQYTLVEHSAVYTIEEMLALHLPHFETVAKNLFVRDAKKRNYYLLVAPHDKQVKLTDFACRAGTTRLSFASQEDLQEILGLYSGAVSPFGILNDREHKVHIYMDSSFSGSTIGVHPNDNTATLYLQADDLMQLLRAQDNQVEYFPVIEAE